jgi:UDP-glucose 4-epimerase
MKTLLLTWATGYIGSHAVVAYEQAWYKTVIIDNLSNSSRETLVGIGEILGYVPDFYEGDIRDRDFLVSVFSRYEFDAVVHFAGLKAVGESCDDPFKYYHNNIEWSISLCEVMEEYSVRKMIFSSSATVYDIRNAPEYREWQVLGTTNPYGSTKLIIERILEDLTQHKWWWVMSLRYFNPIGAHPSGHIWETPSGVPNNLLPYILDVASLKRESVRVYGDDYDTIDGTGVRDYIDVCDLVDAHVLAYERLWDWYEAINIGTGKGTSVLEMIQHVETITGKVIPYTIHPRRLGDIATVYCNPTLASERLGWSARRTIPESIANGWRFIQGQDKTI